MISEDIKRFITNFVAEVEAGNAAIFAGAGLSAPAGFVDWSNLVRPLAEELQLDVDKETDLVAVAQFHVNANQQNRHTLHTAIVNAFSADNPPTINHRLLAKLPITTYWTTNYDKLIETALKDARKIVDVKWAVPQLANTQPRRDAIIYKMHGDVDRPDEAVATRDDYERYSSERGAFINALAGDLVSKSFLFLGFSFTDPNLEHVLARVRITYKNNQRHHYAIFRNRTRRQEESDAEFEYGKIRQALVLEDLKRFNIRALLIDEYSEITGILTEIERQYRSRTIFVSSSASDFTPWDEASVTNFMRTLGAALISSKFRIATGVGLGVGNALLTGALEAFYADSQGHIEDKVLMRPFPQYIPDEEKRKDVWEAYRQDIISSAGIALFLFGNKKSDDTTVIADGMIREFEIAQEHGLTCIPIGATGYAAAELADRWIKEGGNGDTILLEALNELRGSRQNLNELIDPVLKIAAAARKIR
ncbi:MAG: SIR2 family protein [Brucellaceae bacterium]|nr:SIR2 family protein [Brucellaceae bacterium]